MLKKIKNDIMNISYKTLKGETHMGMFIYLIFFFGIILTYLYLSENHEKKEIKTNEENATIISAISRRAFYDDDSRTLVLNEIEPLLTQLITIKADRNMSVQHEPEKLHIGAVTVGNVTTGGSYKTGGYNYIKNEGKSGKYLMYFNGKQLQTIRLSNNLYQKAQHSPISAYLDHSKRVINVVDPVSMTNFESEVAFKMLQSGYIDPKLKQGYPSYDKCKRILEWITNP